MLRFLQSFFPRKPDPTDTLYDDALIDAVIERVVAGTDPRLATVRGYKSELRPAVERSVTHVMEVVDGLPTSVEIGRKAFGSDPVIRALFVSPQHIQDVLARSPALQRFTREQKGLATRGYALLAVGRTERNVLGMELRGDAVRRDVQQVSVSFSDHQLVGMGADEDATRWELKKDAFDHLIECALVRITSTRHLQDQLERARSLLEAKLQAMRLGDWGLETMLKITEKPDIDINAIERQVAELEAELKTLQTDGASLDQSLQRVVAALGEPEANLRVDRITLTLDAMGIKRSDANKAGARTLELDELFLGEDAPRSSIRLVDFSLADIPTPSDLLAKAARSLG